LKLYGYWRSSSAWRVRIALHHKQLPFEYVAVNLLEGEHLEAEHRARNPLTTVPLLEVEDGAKTLRLSQSVAIAEYLEERWPEHPLLPKDLGDRAQVRSLAETVNSFIQPFQNLSVTLYLQNELKADGKAFTVHLVTRGLLALEAQAAQSAGTFLVGDQPTWADCCLVPQMYSARRFHLDLSQFPTLTKVEQACGRLPAFQKAHPDVQPDAPKQ